MLSDIGALADYATAAGTVVQTLMGLVLLIVIHRLLRARERDLDRIAYLQERLARARWAVESTVDDHATEAIELVGSVPPWRYARPELAELAQQARQDAINTVTQILPRK